MIQEIFATIIPFLPWAAIIIVIIVLLLLMVKVVTGNEVLVVTGVGATRKISVTGKNGEAQVTYIPKVKIAGASLVIPVIQRARKFDICVEKANVTNDTMKTKTGVEIVLDWSISYAPNADSVESLLPCIRQFLDKKKDEIQDIVRNAVAGGMRAVISTMTPQEVMVGKETLDDKVQKNISTTMEELGYKVQIYIQEVRDASGSTYYRDLAAEDRETLKRDAANITAKADQEIREKAAETERAAKQAELESQVTIAEKEKETSVKRSAFKAEQERAAADAEIAKQMRQAELDRELAEKNGQVEVMKQQQANLAAEKEQVVKVTQAETAKKQAIINAQAESEQKKIEAEAEANVAFKKAEGAANARKAEASGQAEAKKTQAAADAEAIRVEADAAAARTRLVGEAEAAAISAKGKAEAEAIEAKGKAEAEAARALSDAQAANDRVNFEIRKLEIERDIRIQVATNVAQAMASVGEKATFYDFGGKGGGNGDLLTSVLGNIPQLMKKANLENEALNGEPVTDTLNDLVNAIISPFGALSEKKTVIKEAESGTPEESSESRKPLNQNMPLEEDAPEQPAENTVSDDNA